MRRICLLALLLATAGFTAAAAQPEPTANPPPHDVIGDILDRRVPLPRDEDEPDTAGQPRTAAEPEPEPIALPPGVQARSYTPAPRSVRDAAVRVDEVGKTPDAPPGVRDLAYDSRIRSSFASAQSFQGPLEGGWTLADARDGDRYALQIVDRRDRLEAVWRDLRRTGSLNASGLVDDIQRTGQDLTLRFAASGDMPSVVRLHTAGDGRWTGDMARGDQHFTVTLRRTGP
jgi:hypothetical protein